LVGLAAIITVGAGVGGGDVTVTVAASLAEPPAPLQLNVNVLLAAVSAPVPAVPELARPPLQAPEAVQLVAFVDDHVSELLPPLTTLVGLAETLTVGAGVGGGVGVTTVTVATSFAVPPAPTQLIAKALLGAVNAPVLAVPEAARLPLQAPEAVQPVASVDDQISELLPPTATLAGFAEIVTVGAGAGTADVTVTIAESLAEPPAPLQLSANVLLAIESTPVLAVPAVARLPLQAPEATHAVAFVEVQVSELTAPLGTSDGAATMLTVGGGATTLDWTVTVTDCRTEPPAPVHSSTKALRPSVSAPVLTVPAVARLPVHAPLATHESASDADQVSALLAPLETVVGVASMNSVGAAWPTGSTLAPLHEARARQHAPR
jgi:hypothetical protein